MFSTGSFAKIWESTDKGNYHECKLSTSVKNRQTGEYETDFQGFVRFVGKAHGQMPLPNQRIKITSCGVTRRYDKTAKREYTNFLVFEYELQGDERERARMVPCDGDDDGSDVPF